MDLRNSRGTCQRTKKGSVYLPMALTRTPDTNSATRRDLRRSASELKELKSQLSGKQGELCLSARGPGESSSYQPNQSVESSAYLQMIQDKPICQWSTRTSTKKCHQNQEISAYLPVNLSANGPRATFTNECQQDEQSSACLLVNIGNSRDSCQQNEDSSVIC